MSCSGTAVAVENVNMVTGTYADDSNDDTMKKKYASDKIDTKNQPKMASYAWSRNLNVNPYRVWRESQGAPSGVVAGGVDGLNDDSHVPSTEGRVNK